MSKDELVINEQGSVTLELGPVPTLEIADLPLPPISSLTREHYRQAVIDVENKFVRPIVDRIAALVGVDVIDDEFYRQIVPTTDKSSHLFVILNRDRVRHHPDKGYSEWEGIRIRVKGMILIGVQVQADARTRAGYFRHIRLFDKRIGDYVYIGDPEGNKVLQTESIFEIVNNYLVQESVIKL